jgi:hypothetical protein
MVKVKALRRVYYGGKEYATDDELDETVPAKKQSDREPKPVYKRRDMKAED